MESKKETYNNNNKDTKNNVSENKEAKKEVYNNVSKEVNVISTSDKEKKIKEIKNQIEKLNAYIKKSNSAINCALCADRIKQLRQMIKDLECGESDYKVNTIKGAPSISDHSEQKGFLRGQITNTGEVFEML